MPLLKGAKRIQRGSRAQREPRLFFVMPLAFAARHIGYGLGSLIGLFRLLKFKVLTK